MNWISLVIAVMGLIGWVLAATLAIVNARLQEAGLLALDQSYDSAQQAIGHVGSFNSNEREREAEAWIHAARESGKEALHNQGGIL